MSVVNQYRFILFVYQVSWWLPFLKELLKTDEGLCHCFKCYFAIKYYTYKENDNNSPNWGLVNFPELLKHGFSNSGTYWFPAGELKPRIAILKKVIKDVKLENRKKRDRIRMYQSALFRFQVSRLLPFLKKLLNTDIGFCGYFMYYNCIHIISLVPEIMKYKPEYVCGFWWPRKDMKPRIEILKKVIKDLKSQNEVE